MMKRIKRFNVAERVAHWSQAFAFVVLFLTGAGLIFQFFGDFLGVEGLRRAGLLHRVIGISFPVIVLAVLVLLTPKTTREWLKSLVSWNKDDIRFLMLFPKEFFGGHVKLPPQGKFNAGEKINSLLVIFSSAIMVITGWMLIFRHLFPAWMVVWIHPVHAGTALLLAAVILAHAYLGLGHPSSREAMKGMVKGTVSETFAREHHLLWYEQVKDTDYVVVEKEVEQTALES